jgi:putative inorganic carbon (hco3(-)) transporter
MENSPHFLKLKQFVIVVFLAFIVLSPSMRIVPLDIYLHDAQRLVSLALLAIVLTYAALNTLGTSNFLPVPKNMRIAFYCLLALAVISSALSHYPRHAVLEVSIFASLCYVALFTAELCHDNKEKLIKQFVYVLWISLLLYMFGVYVGYIVAFINKTPMQWPQPLIGFTSIRSFNQYQLWSIGLIALPLLAFDIKQSTKRWLMVALTFWWVLLFYSASRGVLVAWLVGMILTTLIYKKLAWPFLKLQMVSISTGFVAYYALFKLLPSLQQQSVALRTVLRDSTSDRIELWDICIKMMEYHPFVGVGPMHYYWYTKVGTHPHNSVLQLGAEWGIPATLIMLCIAGYGFYCWYKKFNANAIILLPKLECHLSIILFFTIITNAAYSLVDGVIVMPISQVLMFTIIGMMIGQYQHGITLNALNNLEKRQFRFRATFAGIMLIALVWSALPEVIQGLSGNPRGFSSGPNIVNPRIWMQYAR